MVLRERSLEAGGGRQISEEVPSYETERREAKKLGRGDATVRAPHKEGKTMCAAKEGPTGRSCARGSGGGRRRRRRASRARPRWAGPAAAACVCARVLCSTCVPAPSAAACVRVWRRARLRMRAPRALCSWPPGLPFGLLFAGPPDAAARPIQQTQLRARATRARVRLLGGCQVCRPARLAFQVRHALPAHEAGPAAASVLSLGV